MAVMSDNGILGTENGREDHWNTQESELPSL